MNKLHVEYSQVLKDKYSNSSTEKNTDTGQEKTKT